ncbi:hypothetical protein B0T21DRAFT_139178 [Apiosordaria backusii]|uniref:U4/U6.U5 small nuclear ribonucleoprotein 27kDa protein domain-containing protein n=1 Tax=Apiosordaria backusii TaxID=314023 RepID=A0AA40BRT8_9PEZI|nr:hypothetical protein B0T21DRAFT_139178 [Apiosordaria backusii]
MADRNHGHPRRGGDRSHYDNRDRDRRRDHDRRRDRDDDKDRNRSSRDHHGRDRDRDRDRDTRRYRSRSRERNDRRRSRSPGRGDNGRDDRSKSYRQRDEPKEDRGKDRGNNTPADSGRLAGDKPPARDNKPPERRPPPIDPPRRSESPDRGFDREIGGSKVTEKDTQLPTRVKPSSTNASAPSAAPVSFKVKTRDDHDVSYSRGRSEEHDEYHQSRGRFVGRFDADPMDEDEEDDVVVADDGLDDMAAMMGFGGFGTTKGKKVLGNNVGAVKKEKKTEYRQYMNRVGGFNRPLSPPR